MKSNFIFAIILIAVISICYPAAAKDEGGLSGAFLDFTNSTRNYSLGRAGVTRYSDPSSFIENPSLLSSSVNSAYLMFTKPFSKFDDINYQAIMYNNKLNEKSGFGLGIAMLNVSKIENRDDAGNYLGDYDGRDMFLCAGYAYKVFDELSIGANMKYIRQKILNFDGNTYSFDLGANCSIDNEIYCSLTLANLLTNKYTLYSEKQKLPLKLGIAFGATLFEDLNIEFLSELKEYQTSVKFGLGAEYAITKRFLIRSGYNNRFEEWTLGFGFNIDVIKFDYAFGNNTDLGQTHRIALTYKFGS